MAQIGLSPAWRRRSSAPLPPVTTALAYVLLAVLLAVASPSKAIAFNEPVVFCGSPVFERLMSMPVRNAQDDLSFALLTLEQLEVRDDWHAPKCPTDKYRGLSPQTALRVYIERRWMDDVNQADVQKPATIGEAIAFEAERTYGRHPTGLTEDDPGFDSSRREAYNHSLELSLSDADQNLASWDRSIEVRIKNVSNWRLMRGILTSPKLTFRDAGKDPPVSFQCWLATADPKQIRAIGWGAASGTLAPGASAALHCNRVDANGSPQQSQPEGSSRLRPTAGAFLDRWNWTLEPPYHPLRDYSQQYHASDVDVSAVGASWERAHSIVTKSSCAERGACEYETEARRRTRDQNVFLAFAPLWILGIGCGAAGFLLWWSATGLGPAAAAKRLAAILVGAAVLAVAVEALWASGLHGEGAGWGLLGLTMLTVIAIVLLIMILTGVALASVIIKVMGDRRGEGRRWGALSFPTSLVVAVLGSAFFLWFSRANYSDGFSSIFAEALSIGLAGLAGIALVVWLLRRCTTEDASR